MKTLISIAVFSCLLISCSTTYPEPERKCEGGLCGTNYVAPAITQELIEKYRKAGFRVPIYIPKLIYPEFLFYQKMEGRVLVSIDIDKSGDVKAAKVVCFEPNEAFNFYAIEYMEHWKFEPSESETKNQTQLVGFIQKTDVLTKFTKCSK